MLLRTAQRSEPSPIGVTANDAPKGGDIISESGGDYSSEQGGGIISECGGGFPRNQHPNLLAMVLFNKFGLHQPLNRQSETYAAEGMSISVSTLADYVGHGTVLLRGLVDLIETHILAGERIHMTIRPCRSWQPARP